MYRLCVLLNLLVALSCIVTTVGSIQKRELIKQEKDLFKELRDKLTLLEKRLDSRTCSRFPLNKIGFTYTRWGRTICPTNNTELVYSGYVGGSWYDHKGAAVEYLCMPKNPDWDYKYKDGHNSGRGYVFGTEYEMADDHIGIGASYFNHDVPCAVCRVVGGSSVLMIPGKTKCQRSWTKQYSGYLMSTYFAHAGASQYICVDKDAETIPSSSANKNGKVIYPVEARCGSLPCGPYVEGRELGCVVCSK